VEMKQLFIDDGESTLQPIDNFWYSEKGNIKDKPFAVLDCNGNMFSVQSIDNNKKQIIRDFVLLSDALEYMASIVREMEKE